MIGEAKAAGADYVLTPEMTNILEVKRERLFAAIVRGGGRHVARHVPRARAQARHPPSCRLAGDQLSPDRAANRSFLIDPKGEIAARYDKIHMFDVDLAGGESYRELRTYRPGGQAVVADLPWGRLGLSICYDLRFPALYRALAKAGATCWPSPPPSPSRPARRTGTCWCAPARSRTAASCSPRRRAASTRTAATPSAIR